MAKTLYIMRGLPGSGKTTKAQELGGVIVSHDDVLPEDRDTLTPADWKQVKAQAVGKVKRAMRAGAESVVVDNCHVTRGSFMHYERLAERFGYSIVNVDMHAQPTRETVLRCFKRTTHLTPLRVIEEMATRWEPSADFIEIP